MKKTFHGGWPYSTVHTDLSAATHSLTLSFLYPIHSGLLRVLIDPRSSEKVRGLVLDIKIVFGSNSVRTIKLFD